MDELTQRILADLTEDINAGRLLLPALPEVARKVGRMVDDPKSTVAQVAQVIKTDPALSARLLQVANSPMYRPSTPATSVQVAVTRLGTNQVRSIVTTLVMEQLYRIKACDAIRQHIKTLWTHSIKIAALCHVLARHAKLPSEEALLAGLIHDIGVLPILMHAESRPELVQNNTLLGDVIHELHGDVGMAVLKAWNFSSELVTVAGHHEDIYAKRDPAVDLTDLVIIANLHSYMGTQHPLGKVTWDKVPAFGKLGLTPEASFTAIQKAQQEIDEVRQLLLAG